MDIRVQRSKEYIAEEFLKLREKKPLERIKVTELCKNANINKSTFYSHYRDIYDLSEQMENALIREVISSLDSPEDIVNCPDLFTRNLFLSYSNSEISTRMRILFSDSRKSILPQKIEKALKSLIFNIHPEYINKPEVNIMLSYKIYGGFYAFCENVDYSTDLVTEVIGKLSKNNPANDFY